MPSCQCHTSTHPSNSVGLSSSDERVCQVSLTLSPKASDYLPPLSDSNIINICFIGKEARRKELKKNKKQRMAVRHAVLKGKDAQKILFDLDEIDDMGENFYLSHLSIKLK